MKKLLFIIAILTITACKFSQEKILTLADFITIDAIEKAEISNNYGTFLLNAEQLNNLKTALKNLSYEPNQAIKAGAKAVSITIDNKEYWLSTQTHGEMAEITIDNETLVFKTNGLNLDNYEKN